MTRLTYAAVIERDQRARALAELGLRLDLAELPRLMPRLVDLVAPEHLELLAESRSLLGEDGYWLAESDDARRRLIKGAYELHRKKAHRGPSAKSCGGWVLAKWKSSKGCPTKNTTAKSAATAATPTAMPTGGRTTAS